MYRLLIAIALASCGPSDGGAPLSAKEMALVGWWQTPDTPLDTHTHFVSTLELHADRTATVTVDESFDVCGHVTTAVTHRTWSADATTITFGSADGCVSPTDPMCADFSGARPQCGQGTDGTSTYTLSGSTLTVTGPTLDVLRPAIQTVIYAR